MIKVNQQDISFQEAEKVEDSDNNQTNQNPVVPEEDNSNNNNDNKENNNNDNTNTNNNDNTTNNNTGNSNTIPSNVNNYASTMKWQQYWSPGISIQYPTEFALEEIGGYYRGNRQGEIATKITGLATGINKETNEIINSNLIISIYEPELVDDDYDVNKYIYSSSNGLENSYLTTKNGLKWIYQPRVVEEDGYITESLICIEDLNSGKEIVRVDFTTNIWNNYKVLNIQNWFLGNTKLTSY